MAYDNSFYEAYENYLKEDSVRQAHDWIFRVISNDWKFNNVVDLGCGKSKEFFQYACSNRYFGIDLNVGNDDQYDIKADYRLFNFKKLDDLRPLMMPSAFVSLFSSEITASTQENYRLYEKIFNEVPNIDRGLVSGFFYAKRKKEQIVSETGDIQSYQTLEDINVVVSNVFSEKRIILPVPSKMFGDDVFEVWKIFERK